MSGTAGSSIMHVMLVSVVALVSGSVFQCLSFLVFWFGIHFAFLHHFSFVRSSASALISWIGCLFSACWVRSNRLSTGLLPLSLYLD